jgi:hypothetical protein
MASVISQYARRDKMSVIGVIGEKRREAKEILVDLMARVGHDDLVVDIDEGEMAAPKVDVVAAVDKCAGCLKSIIQADGGAVLIMDPDNMEILKGATIPGLVITYGFNNKVCVTASSVMDNEMQICIQRDLPTLNGAHLEQQEFSVAVDTLERDPLNLLAALAALMVSNADVEKLKVLNQ